MLFNVFKTPKSTISNLEVSPSWCVAYGKLDNFRVDVIWQGEKLAVMSAPE
jgi:asparagine synthase (glutamine-hydrolysing)